MAASTQRAAQSHRPDLVALELRGAKLPSLSREIHGLRYRSFADRPRVTGVHTSDASAPAAALDSATLAPYPFGPYTPRYELWLFRIGPWLSKSPSSRIRAAPR